MVARLGWSDEKKANIRKLFADGWTSTKLAARLGCSSKTILTICAGIEPGNRQSAGMAAYHRRKFYTSGANIANVTSEFDEVR